MKERAQHGDRLLGVLLRIPGDELVEMVALSGFDFVLIDCEHGPADLVPLRQHIAAALLHGCPVLVRVGSHEPALVLRALDHGATGIVAPQSTPPRMPPIWSTSVHYPRLGRRGFAGYSRPGRYGLVPAAEHNSAYSRNAGLRHDRVPGGSGGRRGDPGYARPGRHHDRPGRSPSLLHQRRPRPDGVDRPGAHRAGRHGLAAAADRDSAVDATAAFADGANLVVYNLAHTLMDHLAELRRPSSTLTTLRLTRVLHHPQECVTCPWSSAFR